MSGQGEGAAPAGGTPAAAGGAPNGGGGNPAAGGAPAAIDYGVVYGSLTPENKEVFERKGWNKGGKDGQPIDINGVFESYRAAEKLIGGDKLPMPRLDDAEQLNSWEGWKKLGVPDKPEDYKIERAQMPNGPDGKPIPYDENLETVFRTAARKANVPQSMIKPLYDELIAARIAEVGSFATQMAQHGQETEAAIAKEFGASADAHKARAKEALIYMAQQIGVDPGVLVDKTDAAMGSAETIKLFDKIAQMLGEDTLKGGGGAGFQDSPAAAKAEQAKLMQDPNFLKVYQDKHNPGHREAVERMSRLQRLISGSK